ncbi:glycogen synthase GlgA [Thorsellia kenyensis]|uniref:Glycogen synthase n=1 Tax=Thorsellia kenyensis TaxID=1549888 RepID=A0ABV6C7P9_9GAMM
MRILHVCSEFYPLLKTGGLADVLGALPLALKKKGVDSRILIPGFPSVLNAIKEKSALHEVKQIDTFAGNITIFYAVFQKLPFYIIDAPHLYAREGSPYHDEYQNDYRDNAIRFALLSFIGAELANNLDPYWSASIVHAHDWHSGLTPAYLAQNGYPAKSVFTIHNLAFSGCFPYISDDELSGYQHISLLDKIGLDNRMFSIDGLEFHGKVSFLKAGLYYSSHVTTVSPTYAQEITLPDFGCGFDGLLASKKQSGKLTGILNGVDYSLWSPKKDPNLKHSYDARQLNNKSLNKLDLQENYHLTKDSTIPLFSVVSRLSHQKGLDLLIDVIPFLIEKNAQLFILGSGDKVLEEKFLSLAKEYPNHIAVKIGYDEELAHNLTAASDIMLIPSRFEPCGLTQLYAMKYGTLPLVRNTGGLADTVVDITQTNITEKLATGIVFNQANTTELIVALEKTFSLWQNKTAWKQVQKNAMKRDFSWSLIADAYIAIYQSL